MEISFYKDKTVLSEYWERHLCKYDLYIEAGSYSPMIKK